MRAVCECEATCLPAAAKRFITARLASAAALPSRRPSWLAYNLSRRIGKGEESMAEEIRAPLAGTVLSVLVEAGAKVDVDDELLVIEAMKMENLVYAPCAGAVRDIKVHAGDKVDAGDLLLIIE
jgi:biotin carboxyl carrier protein